jgi:hypothetical protein
MTSSVPGLAQIAGVVSRPRFAAAIAFRDAAGMSSCSTRPAWVSLIAPASGSAGAAGRRRRGPSQFALYFKSTTSVTAALRIVR